MLKLLCSLCLKGEGDVIRRLTALGYTASYTQVCVSVFVSFDVCFRVSVFEFFCVSVCLHVCVYFHVSLHVCVFETCLSLSQQLTYINTQKHSHTTDNVG